MTFCLGMRVQDGVIGIADTRITSGNECITAKKVTVFQKDHHSMFMMTSGLRSVRDKALTYFEEVLEEQDRPFDRLYHAVNGFAEQVRRVMHEDKESLSSGGVRFDFYGLIGGQLEKDKEHKLYMLYSEGNWLEISSGTPYHIIGTLGYGKPILDRTLRYEDTMRHALKVGCLAFDSTRISAADVDFPVDIALYQRDSFSIVEHRYTKEDFADISAWWQNRLRSAVAEIPSEWIERAFDKLEPRANNVQDVSSILER